jgi:hypothetical protein
MRKILRLNAITAAISVLDRVQVTGLSEEGRLFGDGITCRSGDTPILQVGNFDDRK